MNTSYLRRILPDLLVVVAFAAISFVYFFPADTEGRILYRHDSSAGKGANMEQAAYQQRTGERTRWTNALFSGMPTYQMAPSYDSTDHLSKAEKVYHLFLPDYVWYVFAYLLGFYILLRAFDFRWYLAALGSVLWAFSSYFFIIIAAGHIWKVIALAYIPPTIAGVVLAYRGKYLWAGIVTALFTAMQVKANHLQMSYYFLFVLMFMFLAYLYQAWREGTWARFAKATLTCIVGAVLGVAINASNLYHTWQYSQESMRGKSELRKADSANQTSSGLERDYITQWSYGISETWTLLVPNVKGGSSTDQLVRNEASVKADKGMLPEQLAQFCQQFPQYFGQQPFTAGPVYVGAFVLMLFILGLFIVQGPMKWALLAATVLSILLSWGKNFMPFTNFFIDYMPLYAKFRTVSSILVVAEFTIPLLAMFALKKIVDEPDILTRKVKYVYVSFALTAGVALLFALMPTLCFSQFTNDSDLALMQRYVPADVLTQYQAQMLTYLQNMRVPLVTADAWRSFAIIVVGTLALLLFKARTIKAPVMVAIVGVLCLGDLWLVNKRYLNDGMFVESYQRDAPQERTPTDDAILLDQSLDYRVLNLASDTYNENNTSYYHKSIGGYHAAKLRRYQELIDAYIYPQGVAFGKAFYEAQGDMTKVNGDSIFPVLNMLNAKYFIYPLQNNQTAPVLNPYAYGNAWFVDKVVYAGDANEELAALGQLQLRHQAVADKRFADILGSSNEQDTLSLVTITSYDANHLTYDVQSGKGGVVVFSEIYYPGWTATVDGQDVPVGRVDYVLRAISVQPGRHQVELTFKPKSVTTTETIAYVAYAILLLALLAGVATVVRKRKNQEQND